jgi:Fe-S-cluster containining protein
MKDGMMKKKPATVDLGGADLEARRTQRLYTVGQLRNGRTPLQVIEIVDHAVAVGDAAVRAALARTPPRAPSACREGCAWCCYKRVGSAAPEVLRIAAYLKETLSAEGLEALRQRVQRGVEERRGGRTGLACPLLVEDRCAAYPVRPLTCRGYNSSDARRCERSLDPNDPVEVPAYVPQQRLFTFVLDGLRAGAQESRLDGELLELTAALEIALRTPDAGARWLAGEAVFAPARLH